MSRTGAHLNDEGLTNADLEGAHLDDLHYFNPHLTRRGLAGANLQSAHPESGQLDDADLAGAYLNRARPSRRHGPDRPLTRTRWSENAAVPEG